MSDYPEHDKLRAVVVESQAIGEFIDWLEDVKNIYVASHAGLTKLLAEFYMVDLDKIEAEKQIMLRDLEGALNDE